MTDNAIQLLLKKDVALDVITLMRQGMSMTEACSQKGIDIRTFNNTLARFPEIKEAIQEYQQSRLASLVENIVGDQVENAQALSEYALVLRERVRNSVLADDSAKILMKVDRHLGEVLKIILPNPSSPSNIPAAPSGSTDSAAANKILSSMKGANLKRIEVRKTESYEILSESEDGESAIEGVISEADSGSDN